MVCIPYPQQTVGDHLVGAEVVVLARENPDKAFSYIAVEVLKGELDSPEIDLFVNSAMRRRLALNPDRSVVLALGGARSLSSPAAWRTHWPDDGASPSTWRYIGYATSIYEDVVREILARAPRWRERGGGENRARFFMQYLAADESAIRELAYLEVGQASYDEIREADRFVPPDQLREFLATPQYLEWHSLYILLLGVDATSKEKDAIRAALARCAKFDLIRNLAAWATALIEIDGEEAVAWLESVYLGARDRHLDAVGEVVKALSVHGSRGRSALRGRIAESYGVLMETHPALAGWAARDLTAWNDWRFANKLGELRKGQTEMDGATAYAIDLHVRRARSRVSD